MDHHGSSDQELAKQLKTVAIDENGQQRGNLRMDHDRSSDREGVGIENSAVDSRSGENASGRETRAASVLVAPIPKEMEKYTMSKENRGVALIFNHMTYMPRKSGKKPEDRTGTDEDKKKLEATFKNLGFDVTVFDNKTRQEIQKELRKVAAKDHKSSHCLVVAVLTHGGDNGYLQAKDGGYHVTQLFKHFTSRNCSDLKGKPKLFFIQACRGSKTDIVPMPSKTAHDNIEESQVNNYPVPSYADFLISYATFIGQCAFRNEDDGSPYIYILCRLLDEHSRDMDLLTLLTLVNQYVGQKLFSMSPESECVYQQMPCFTSSLTKYLRF